MSEIGEIIIDMDNNDNIENPEAPADEPPILLLKSFESAVVTLLAKVLFKISLLVPVLYLLGVVLSFIELVVLRMLFTCLLSNLWELLLCCLYCYAMLVDMVWI